MTIRSRYGDTYEFTEVPGGLEFRLPAYTRIGFGDNPGEIYFIDPPGGPFLSIGGRIGDQEITGFEDSGDYVVIKTTQKGV